MDWGDEIDLPIKNDSPSHNGSQSLIRPRVALSVVACNEGTVFEGRNGFVYSSEQSTLNGKTPIYYP